MPHGLLYNMNFNTDNNLKLIVIKKQTNMYEYRHSFAKYTIYNYKKCRIITILFNIHYTIFINIKINIVLLGLKLKSRIVYI